MSQNPTGARSHVLSQSGVTEAIVLTRIEALVKQFPNAIGTSEYLWEVEVGYRGPQSPRQRKPEVRVRIRYQDSVIGEAEDDNEATAIQTAFAEAGRHLWGAS